jgi:hypothetical protein
MYIYKELNVLLPKMLLNSTLVGCRVALPVVIELLLFMNILPPSQNVRHISLVRSHHLLSLTKFIYKKNEHLEY